MPGTKNSVTPGWNMEIQGMTILSILMFEIFCNEKYNRDRDTTQWQSLPSMCKALGSITSTAPPK
jgi:hypothetical protein